MRQPLPVLAYALRWLIPAAVVAALAAALASLLDGDDKLVDRPTRQALTAPALPPRRIADLPHAAALARCDVQEGRGQRMGERAAGRRALDAAYEERPPAAELAGALRVGRVVVEYRPTVAHPRRAQLRALFAESPRALLVTPSNPETRAELTATSRRASLTCGRFNERVFDAVRAFRDRHRHPKNKRGG